MRRRVLLLVGVVFAGVPATGAGAQVDSLLAQQFETDFAVPDAPAFALLSSTPSAVLRPTSVRALTAAFSGFAGGSDALVQLPRAFAVEFSPLLLARGTRLTLAEYQRRPSLYRTRVSMATQRSGAGSATELALAARVTLYDQADLRMNPRYVAAATGVAAAINDVYVGARRRTGPPPAPIVLTEAEQDSVNRLLQPVRERWADSAWNTGAFEVALGALAAAADSLGGDARMRSWATWATWARGFGDWGQLLVGGRGELARDSVGAGELQPGGSLSARLYVGGNAYKFFLETQGSGRRSRPPGWLLHGGGEARVRPSLWANFSTGVRWDDGTPRLVSNLGLRVAAPVGK